MNKKIIGLGVATLSLGVMLVTPTANAFWGGNTSESFTEMKQMIQSFNSWEDFREAMKEKREAGKVERETMQEKVSHEVEKLENGVVITTTTDDADVLEKMKERHEKGENRQGRNQENVVRLVETLENGFRTTITTEDEDTLTRLHDRADNGWKMNRRHGKRNKMENRKEDGQKMNRGKGRRGQRNGYEFEDEVIEN